MKFDMRELDLGARYKIVNSTITPRPIAWIVTQGESGVINAAPYSFFNACGVEPMMSSESAPNFVRPSGDCRKSRLALFSFATSSFGSRAGPKMPNQFETIIPVTPLSSNVGTSGSALARFAVVTPIARSRADFTCGIAPGIDGNAAGI